MALEPCRWAAGAFAFACALALPPARPFAADLVPEDDPLLEVAFGEAAEAVGPDAGAVVAGGVAAGAEV